MKRDGRENMRILFLIDRLCIGGAERVVTILANSLIKEGCTAGISVFHVSDKDYKTEQEVQVFCMGNVKGDGTSLFSKIKRINQRKTLIKNAIEQFQPDVVIPFLVPMVIETVSAAKKLKIPVIATMRCSLDSQDFLRKCFYKAALVKCAAVFLQTESQKNYLNRMIRKKSFVLANPVSQHMIDAGSKRNYRDEMKRFVSVGRLEKQKNYEMLLAAAALADGGSGSMILDIYGVGSQAGLLEKMIKEKNLSQNVRICGWSSQIETVLTQYDAFLMTSNYEGMPNALMEAMAAGMPCIVTDCPTGPRELIGNNERGLLVRMGDIESFADAMKLFMKNPKMAKDYGILAGEYMKNNYSAETISKKLLNQICRVINK